MKSSLAILVALFAFGGIAAAAATPAPKSVTIRMNALNGSGENGTATLTQTKSGVAILLKLVNTPKYAQPTHIHIGTCGKIDAAPEYGLKSTIGGSSKTMVIGIKLADLLKGHYAINVHKSARDLKTYVSCGNIVK